MYRFRISGVVGLLAVLLLPPPPLASAAAPKGIRPDLLYHNYCSVCHGDKGDGRSRARSGLRPPPKDFTTAGPSLTREVMIAAVADGKPGTAMVGWKTQLSQAEIAAVVDWVIANFMSGKPAAPVKDGVSGTSAHGGRAQDASPAKPAATANMSLPFALGLKGNAANGRAFYDANCATCHGKKGDGKGPRAYFIRPKPRNFLEPASRATLNRPMLYEAVSMGRLGTEMPAWSKVLNEQQIADVSEYVFQQFIRPKGKAGK
jgi:mono/diheme cytochrome c family protein